MQKRGQTRTVLKCLTSSLCSLSTSPPRSEPPPLTTTLERSWIRRSGSHAVSEVLSSCGIVCGRAPPGCKREVGVVRKDLDNLDDANLEMLLGKVELARKEAIGTEEGVKTRRELVLARRTQVGSALCR